MPRRIKQEPSSSSSANANPRMVPEEELNKLKRKLEQTQEELREEKDKSKQLKALMATDVQNSTRETIRLNLPDFAKSVGQDQQLFAHFSETIEIAGFQWELCAARREDDISIGLCLYAISPDNYQGPFEFDVDCTFRLFNAFSSKDIHREGNFKITRCTGGIGHGGLWNFADIKTILDPKNGFLRGDGSVQVEVDFTIKTATLNHFLVDDPAQKMPRLETMREAPVTEREAGMKMKKRVKAINCPGISALFLFIL